MLVGSTAGDAASRAYMSLGSPVLSGGVTALCAPLTPPSVAALRVLFVYWNITCSGLCGSIATPPPSPSPVTIHDVAPL